MRSPPPPPCRLKSGSGKTVLSSAGSQASSDSNCAGPFIVLVRVSAHVRPTSCGMRTLHQLRHSRQQTHAMAKKKSSFASCAKRSKPSSLALARFGTRCCPVKTNEPTNDPTNHPKDEPTNQPKIERTARGLNFHELPGAGASTHPPKWRPQNQKTENQKTSVRTRWSNESPTRQLSMM